MTYVKVLDESEVFSSMASVTGVASIRVEDQYGITGTTDYFVTVDDTQTVHQMILDLASLVTVEGPLTQGAITGASIRVFAGTTPGTPAGDIEKGGLFNFNNATDGYAQGYFIPDINPDVLNAAGLIDLTLTAVTDFITFMTTAHTAITVVTKGVRALTDLRDALISFRKHRKPLERKTKELG